MSVRWVRAPEWLAAAGGTALLISLFLPWYAPRGIAVPAGATGYAPLGTLTAWQAFAVIDVLLAVLALSGPALFAVQATRVSPALPSALAVIVACSGVPATLLVLARLLFPPGDAGLEAGAWIALAAALGLLASGWWALRAERSPGAPVPDVELRPAPPAAG